MTENSQNIHRGKTIEQEMGSLANAGKFGIVVWELLCGSGMDFAPPISSVCRPRHIEASW
jgi:hypothetical protein